MKTFKEKLLSVKNERGSSELPVTLILLPLVIFLIFALIDVSFYMNTRSQVQSVLNQGVRQMALYGGNAANLPLNKTGKPVATIIHDNLWKNGACTLSGCTVEPVVTCDVQKATYVGQPMSCTVVYDYSPVADDTLIGFTQFLTSPAYSITSTTVSEVGQ